MGTVTKVPAKAERWSLETQARFLEALAATCNVAKSLRAVGMKDSGVYKLRLKSPAFRAAWEVALREGYVRLELLMLERAINGTKKTLWHGKEKIGEAVEHDSRLGLQLLQQHARLAKQPAAVETVESEDEIRAALKRTFAEMGARMEVAGEG